MLKTRKMRKMGAMGKKSKYVEKQKGKRKMSENKEQEEGGDYYSGAHLTVLYYFMLVAVKYAGLLFTMIAVVGSIVTKNANPYISHGIIGGGIFICGSVGEHAVTRMQEINEKKALEARIRNMLEKR